MLFLSESIQLTAIAGQTAKVHLVSTGGVTVKTKFRQATTTGLLAKISFMLDRKYSDWLPIWVMIIEHPEGIFVIDTGENANINDPGYFDFAPAMVKWFNTTQYRFKVEREEEIDRQLESLQIPTDRVKTVILTHLHLDHVDGLRHFPNNDIIVNKAEWEKPYGDLPKLYPSWFKPRLVELSEKFEEFDKACYVTAARDIVLVETPGHTWHHCSVVFRTKECDVFFGADVCYDQQQIINNKFSGTNASHRLAKDTYRRVGMHAKANDTIFIPSHDPGANIRMRKKSFLFARP